MSNLQKYSQFSKSRKKGRTLPTSREVWAYTRVSSKNQQDNYSLVNQKEVIEEYADENGYKITEYFGNQNESASNDITRKEFQTLINKVKKSRQKPFGILVFVINRFSRSGGNAISIVNDLVERLNVHLIEVSSGIDTTTDEGMLNILDKLIEAKKDNNQRLKHTIPGMKKFVKSGQYLGIAPMGYDHFGPRVVDPSKRSIKQRIEVNDIGEKLKKAWNWKIQGLNDVEIINKLNLIGVKISKQKLSAMWRKAFYCGIQTNAFLDGNPIKGKWEPLISEKTFWDVQKILDGNHHGYQIEKQNDCRPLIGTIFCPKCSKKLTGYIVRKKNRHYYKCQTCIGVSLAAESSLRMQTKGAHEMFEELLDSYKLDEKYIEPFKLQLIKSFKYMKEDTLNERKNLKRKIESYKEDLNKLDERYAFGKFDDEVLYRKLRLKKQSEIDHLQVKVDGTEIEISNLKSKFIISRKV